MTTHRKDTRLPIRRRGGQELPDAVQDRPEQNAGYDAAVRGESGEPVVVESDSVLGALDDEHRGVTVRRTPDE